MNKMTSQIENIVNAYKTLSKIPSAVGGKLIKNGSKITSKWSVRNLDKEKHTKFLYNYVLDDSFNVIAESEFGIDISNELLTAVSPKETFKAVIREEKDSKDAKKQYLEVWRKSSLVHSINLTALDIHGDVYADSEFATLDWSPDESSIVYVAERKLPKSEPYIKRKSEDKAKTNGSGETAPKKGEEYLYRQDWGEQLAGKHLSVVVLCRLQTETCSVLEGLPASWCPGQVRFSPDGRGVVGVAWETEPRRLGLIFCTNRPSYIFSLTFDGQMRKLSAEGMAVRSPRFSPLGDLVWLQRKAGGPHHACHALVMIKKGQSEVKTVIDIVQSGEVIEHYEVFRGLYCQALPARCFSADGRRIVFSTPQALQIKTYVADLETGRMALISNIPEKFGSLSVLDVASDVILAVYSSMTTPGQLHVSRLPAVGSEPGTRWVRVSEERAVPPALAGAAVRLVRDPQYLSTDSVKGFSWLYLAPQSGTKLPLLVWPHGGPHSSFVDAFGIEAALFCMLGMASLQVNYRGSTGDGQASIDYLLKRIGEADVQDCKKATESTMHSENVDAEKIGLVGGSHGGFLVAHLSGQYPDLYKAVVARNPVIDVASMFNSSDIADCGQYPDLSKAVVTSNPVVDVRACSTRILLTGLASIRINYRGSTGHGEAFVHCLLAHGGDYDVTDCRLALSAALEQDARLDGRLLLNGGSYGGFVTAHLAAIMDVEAMVMRNPLIDLATKGHYADNSDSCAVEAGFEFTEKGPISEEQLLAMRRCSPLAHAHKVKAPTALLLGRADLRLPRHQGLEYARRLKANGVETRIYMYDDNHSLSSLPAEMDNLINTADWFLTHLDVKPTQ